MAPQTRGLSVCPSHAQFERRLDDRFHAHVADQAKTTETMFDKLDLLNSKISRLETRIAWIGGGLTVVAVIGRPIFDALAAHWLK